MTDVAPALPTGYTGDLILNNVIAFLTGYEAVFADEWIASLLAGANDGPLAELIRDYVSGRITAQQMYDYARTLTWDQAAIEGQLEEAFWGGGRVTAESLRLADPTLAIGWGLGNERVRQAFNEVQVSLVGINQATNDGVASLIAQSVRDGWPTRQLTQSIYSQVGLLPSHVVAVDNYRRSLVQAGASSAQITRQTDAYAHRLRQYRADMVAATEVASAANKGQHEFWIRMKEYGVLPPRTMRKWLTAKDELVCPVCGPLQGAEAEIGGSFLTIKGTQVAAPPAHPHCRCTTGLVFHNELGKAEEWGLLLDHGQVAKLQVLQKFNPYHDELGRFTTAENAVTISGGTYDYFNPLVGAPVGLRKGKYRGIRVLDADGMQMDAITEDQAREIEHLLDNLPFGRVAPLYTDAVQFNENGQARITRDPQPTKFSFKEAVEFEDYELWLGRVDSLTGQPYSVQDLTKRLAAGAYLPIPNDKESAAIIAALGAQLAHGKPMIRVSADVLQHVLEDGRFKNQFETGTTNGALAPDVRTDEEQAMGVPAGAAHDARPIYGYIGGAGWLDSIPQYGDVVVGLKPEVLDRATVTWGDSLGEPTGVRATDVIEGRAHPNAVFMAMHPRHVAVMRMGAIRAGADVDYVPSTSLAERITGAIKHKPYLEAQYHGGLTVGDIESVDFTEGFKTRWGRFYKRERNLQGNYQIDFDKVAEQRRLEARLRRQGVRVEAPWHHVVEGMTTSDGRDGAGYGPDWVQMKRLGEMIDRDDDGWVGEGTDEERFVGR